MVGGANSCDPSCLVIIGLLEAVAGTIADHPSYSATYGAAYGATYGATYGAAYGATF